MQLGYNQLKSKVKQNYSLNSLHGEVYVKMLYDINNPKDSYQWYVSLITKNDEMFAVVIDNQTGKVLSKNF